MNIDRRTALTILAAGVVPTHAATPQFFTPEEYRLLDRITEMIIPADEHSPGASAARVADFIDLVIGNSPAEVQQRWRAGMRLFEGPSPDTVLNQTAAEERAPTSDAGKFFVEMKRMTLHAYYTSEIGLRNELGYLGPEVLGSFPGCKT